MDLNTSAEIPSSPGQQQQSQQQDQVSDQQANDARTRTGQPDQQQQQNQQQQNQKPPFTILGILHYLQHEWHRYEVERQEWEVEKAELSAKIALLQGEKKSHENLRHDLIRRIKMLEYCLRMERAKYHRLKHGTDPPPESLTNSKNEQQTQEQSQQQDGSENASDGQQQQKTNTQQPQVGDGFLIDNSSTITYGRELLKHYLQEIGYTDTIIDLRSNRVRSLLGIVDNNQSPGNSQQTSQVSNDDDDSSNNSGGPNTSNLSTINNFNNVDKLLASSERTNKVISVGVRSDSSEFTAATTTQNTVPSNRKGPLAAKMSSGNTAITTSKMSTSSASASAKQQRGEVGDAESTVLATFGFLYDQEGLKEASQLEDDDEEDDDEEDAVSDDIVDAADRAASTTSEYSYIDKEFSDATAIMRQKLDLLNDAKSSSSSPNDRRRDLANRTLTSNNDIAQASVPSGTNNAKNWCPQPEKNDTVDIGELATLTTLGSETNGDDSRRRQWSNKYRLQSHFDCVRDIKFTKKNSLIVTASEDETIKLWSLGRQSNASGKSRQPNLPPSINAITSLEPSLTDKEPLHTYRGHRSRVLSLAVDEDYIYSGAQDGEIIQWKIIQDPASADIYSTFDETLLVCRLQGHEDAVWSLEIVDYPKKSNWLHSVSADLTMRIWSTAGVVPKAYKVIKLESSPTCIIRIPPYNQYRNADVAIASCDGKIRLYNTEEVVYYEDCMNSGPTEILESDESHRINSIVIHPTLPYLASADSNRSIKFWDLITKKCKSAMVAHLDEVTSLACDPTGKFLLSASHDCSARMWLFEERACIQEITSHRKKFDEGIFAVAFHPLLSEFATAGADGLAKVYSSIS